MHDRLTRNIFTYYGGGGEFRLMLSRSFLYELNAALVAPALFSLLLVASEIGFRRGRSVGSSLAEASKSQLSSFQGAMMGLLALLLGFNFALAESRFEARRQLVVEESNAIGTTYLRSQMLSEPLRTEAARLLREYVEVRLEFFQAGLDEDRLKGAIDHGCCGSRSAPARTHHGQSTEHDRPARQYQVK